MTYVDIDGWKTYFNAYFAELFVVEKMELQESGCLKFRVPERTSFAEPNLQQIYV